MRQSPAAGWGTDCRGALRRGASTLGVRLAMTYQEAGAFNGRADRVVRPYGWFNGPDCGVGCYSLIIFW